MSQLTDWLVYLLVRIVICIIQALDLQTCHSLARLFGWLAADVIRLRGRVVDDNLHGVFPELSATERRRFARRMWEHLMLMVCEIAHASRKIHDTNWRKHVNVHRKPELVGYLLDPRPVVLVSGHFGNFELTSYLAGLLGFRTYAIARRLDNPYLHDYVNSFRSRNGQFILPKDGSSAEIDAVLNAGGAVALLGDQHAGVRGCWVDFLGRPASCHKAVALFTLVSGAPLCVTYGKRTGGPLEFELGVAGIADPKKPTDELGGVKPLTRWYNEMLEGVIRTAPEQYWWVHRRWKGEPPKRKKRQAESSSAGDSEAKKSAA